ncbi:NAD-dependent epimerase/dehydratase family protein [Cypionkella sp. TWP1-2-1b2]|uniref:NAD-dependent epimerase/dehydratase family protein n=1 Tax=Cypionkella sp. TWP1-2-1b2 TaxID=2804675 RepID=UPI003CE820AD
MNILALGGNGFLGWHLVNELAAAGHRVTVLGRRAEPQRPLPNNAEYVSVNLSDRPALVQLLTGIDAVAHLASATVPSTGDKDKVADVQINLVGTLNLLEAMIQSGCRRLLFVSSGGTVYGIPQHIPIHEHHTLAPICSYGIVKVAIESYLALFARTHAMKCLILRASNPYGPCQGNLGVQGIIGTYLGRAREGQPIEIWGDGSAIRDYIYVGDLARLGRLAIEGEASGVFNAVSGMGSSVAEVAECVRRVTGREVPVLNRPRRTFDVPISVLDISKAKTTFNWQPRIGLEEGISKTWRWLEETSRA